MRVVLVVLCLGGPVCADISGPIRVVDGDTFEIAEETVRLFGIDAPENGQPCALETGEVIDCGEWVTQWVTALYSGKTAACNGIERDRYGRLVATCDVGGMDVGRTLVTQGLARAYVRYSQDYVLDEKGAAIAGRGLWQFEMSDPAAFRAAQIGADEVPEQCQIKGNVSANGRIYHVPGNRDYDRTRINISNGERYFCTEAEARAAGWRPARN